MWKCIIGKLSSKLTFGSTLVHLLLTMQNFRTTRICGFLMINVSFPNMVQFNYSFGTRSVPLLFGRCYSSNTFIRLSSFCDLSYVHPTLLFIFRETYVQFLHYSTDCQEVELTSWEVLTKIQIESKRFAPFLKLTLLLRHTIWLAQKFLDSDHDSDPTPVFWGQWSLGAAGGFCLILRNASNAWTNWLICLVCSQCAI